MPLSIGRRGLLVATFASLVGLALPLAAARADDWPSRPVTLVVPFGPGAITDQSARMLAQLLERKYKQPFIVENRPGAGSLVGSRQVSASKPDGYTLMVTAFSVATLGLGTDNEFNPLTELTPIARLLYQPNAMLVPTSANVNTVPEWIAYVKANPDKAFFGLTDLGGSPHLRYLEFMKLAGVEMKPIVYQSGSEIVLDTSQERLAVTMLSVSSGLNLVNAGLLKVLAYTGSGLSEGSPKAPDIKESGIDFEWITWTGFFGPPGMDKGLVNTINTAVTEAMAEPEFMSLLEKAGSTYAKLSADEFTDVVKGDRELTLRLMKEFDVKPGQ